MLAAKTKQRIWIFLGFAFGISWATGGIIYLTGGLENSPSINIGGAPLTLAFLLLATIYMFGPAIANLLTRLITQEGRTNLKLQPHFDRGKWIFWLAAWFLPGLLTLVGAAFFFLIFPQYFDPKLSMLTEQLQAQGTQPMINLWLVVAIQALQAMLIAPLLNAISTFGEEFGWRGYLQPKLMPLGSRKAILLTGLIWGIWHWPIILMGYNFGADYWGAPFLGPLAMVWFTLTLSIIFGWLTIKTDTVWPAVIAHGALNGITAIGVLLLRGTPSTLLGPAPIGFVGGIGLTVVALTLLVHPRGLQPTQQAARYSALQNKIPGNDLRKKSIKKAPIL